MTSRYTIAVPATTANLGPGYDRLGLALDLYLESKAVPASDWKFDLHGEGSHLLDTCELNLIARAYGVACRHHGWAVQPMLVECNNAIPIARGLGSSAAAIVTGMALAQLANTASIDKDALFHQAADMEGHPDNVAAAVYGGLQEINPSYGPTAVVQHQIADRIKVLLVIPTGMKSTAELRAIVPASLPSNLQQETEYALEQVLAGLAAGNPDQLRYSEQDHRHQPYRLDKQPESKAIFEILRNMPGIAGAFLSGAGSTVAGWVVGDPNPVAAVEQHVAAQNIQAAINLRSPDFKGVEGSIIHE